MFQECMETELIQGLTDRNVKVDIGPASTTVEEEIFNSVKSRGADAILTVSIIDRETESRYVPGSYAYSPYPAYAYYGSFRGYGQSAI